jgi:5-methylcytosine-specific restriction endonuclease McrA
MFEVRKPYAEMLRDVRWQKRKAEICQRDSWRCQRCAATDRQLHVHHLRYLPGHAPWEYEDLDLQTLCYLCHAEESGKRDTDPYLEVVYQAMARAHREGRWDEEYLWAEEGQRLLDEGFYYRGIS